MYGDPGNGLCSVYVVTPFIMANKLLHLSVYVRISRGHTGGRPALEFLSAALVSPSVKKRVHDPLSPLDREIKLGGGHRTYFVLREESFALTSPPPSDTLWVRRRCSSAGARGASCAG